MIIRFVVLDLMDSFVLEHVCTAVDRERVVK